MMLANNAELIAVMEINMELAEKSRAKWGCKRAYDSEAALLADPEIDAVYIASPVVLHAKQAMMAADAGKHILIEKPLGTSFRLAHTVVKFITPLFNGFFVLPYIQRQQFTFFIQTTEPFGTNKTFCIRKQ